MSVVSLALREGLAAAQARQFDRARPLLERATIESPDNPVGWFWLAIASPSAAQAIPCLRQVLTLDPSHGQARDGLARLLRAEAQALAAAGKRPEARALAVEAAALTPDAPGVWLALVALTDDQVERIDALRQAAARAPEDQQIHTTLRQALLARGVMIATTDRAEARARFREAAALKPDDLRVWQALVNLADTHAEWIDSLRELIRIAPDHQPGREALRNALVTEAQSLAASGLVDDACARWRDAIEVAGGDVEAWLGLAAITPDPDEASRAVEKAYELDPTHEDAILAMERLRGPQIDPATIAPPIDAFARFSAPSDDLTPAGFSDDAIDSSFDTFATLEVSAPAPLPAPAPAPTLFAAVTADVIGPQTEPAPDAIRSGPDVDLTESALVVTPEAVADSPAPAAPPLDAEPAPQRATRTVMIVDDSPTIRKILGLTLERAGYTVLAEPDGESAIHRLDSVLPDLILLDIAMPKLDGYEVCKHIKQDPRTAAIPVVMLSGKDALFDKVKGHLAGAAEYLTKPFETPAVLAVVTSYCQPSPEVVHG